MPDNAPGRLSEFFAYWERRRGSRSMPSRDDLDPLDIPKLLASTFLVDVLEDDDFRYRLVGERIVDRAGANYTGRRLSELTDKGSQPLLYELYRRVTAHRRPEHRQLPYRMPHTRAMSQYEVLVAPLSPDDTRVDMLFGIAVYPDDPDA